MRLYINAASLLHYHRVMAHAFTIGVEEEFQIVDPETWELRSHVSELLNASGHSLGDHAPSVDLVEIAMRRRGRDLS